MSSRRERPRPVARKAAYREPHRRLLVVCEGEVTEVEYLNGFSKHARGALVQLRVVGGAGVPMTLVETARDQRESAEEAARRERDDYLRYDEVWCVFDVDEHPRVQDARQTARDNGLSLAMSNPCFELWLLLHLRDSPGAQHRHRIQRMLRDEMPNAESKHIDFDQLINGYDAAFRRAERLDPETNPFTEMHLLTDSIDELGRAQRAALRNVQRDSDRNKADAAAQAAYEQFAREAQVAATESAATVVSAPADEVAIFGEPDERS